MNLKKLQKFDASYLRGRNYFVGNDGTQNYLVFQPMPKYFKMISNAKRISSWKSKRLFNEIIKPLDSTYAPELIYSGETIYVKFDGNYSNQDKTKFNHRKIVNIYIAYEMTKNIPTNSSYLIIQNSLFCEIGFIKGTTIDEFKVTGYGIGFDSKGTFSHPNGGVGRNVLIFGADMSSSVHVANKNTSILVLGEGLIQISGPTLYAENMYSVNFTEINKKFCLSLLYNGANSYLFVNGTEFIKFKTDESKTIANTLCLGNISKETDANGTDKTSLYGHIYDFSVDYNPIAIDNILDIHKYL